MRDWPARAWWWARGAIAVCGRELLSLFVTPLAYLVGTLFLLNQGWNFSLLLRFLNDPLAAPGPVMQFYFGGSFFIFWLPVIFICSTISMRLVAEERRQGTLEALLTAPLQPSQIVLGKYVGALVFYITLWLPTGIFYVLLRGATTAGPGATPEPGPIFSGYFGTLLVGASFLAIGTLASALARSQLAAAIGTFVTCTIVLLTGLLVDQVESETLASMLEWSSLLVMQQEMAQGIVDLRWPCIHLGVVVTALSMAILAVDPRRNLERGVQVVLIGFAAFHLSVFAGRHASRSDWTRGQVYTLSDRAETVLKDLHGPIDVTVIIPSVIGAGRPNPLLGEVREVLMRMARVSPALRVRIVDPDRDRQESEQLLADYGLGGRELADGVILIRAGTGAELRRSHLLPTDLVTYATGPDVQVNGPRVEAFRGEEALLTKFLEVSEPRRLKVCYTQGHGEPAFDDLEPYAGYAHLDDLLKASNLETQLAELGEPEGLEGCDVLLVAGPQARLPEAHVSAIDRYLQGGGHLLLLSGAVIVRGGKGLIHHGLEPVLDRYGIHFGERVVLDPHQMAGASPLLAYTLQEGWGDHPAVRSLVMRPISFVQVRELWLDGPAERLMQVGEQAWAESDVDGFQDARVPEYDGGGQDRAGPIPVAAASEVSGSRVVVIASDQFALNALLREDVAYDHGRDLIHCNLA